MQKQFLYFLFFFVGYMPYASAQQFDYNNSVQLQLTEQTEGVLLSWPAFDGATSYLVYRRAIGANSWGAAVAMLDGTATSYVDASLEEGTAVEYRVNRLSNGSSGNGYMYASKVLPAVEDRGMLILVIDSTFQLSLAEEIDLLMHDFTMDSWEVMPIVVSPSAAVESVKAQIEAIYEAHPERANSVLLLGHIPVPYAGVINPDGHGNHIGAWPADAYYGDIDGNWTDNFVDNTTAAQARNHNVPGDGKFDNSTIPSEVELAVGRVDFHSLPAFDRSEEELLRQYILKNHAYKTKAFSPVRRGLIENNFGGFEEGFGQNGLKNFTAMFGADSVFYRDYHTLRSESYLWSYGCGGGNYTGAGGISNTNNFANDSLQSVFTMLFGSYFGDWDSNNNFLRAALGTGTVLTNAWAGRPNWQFHPMAIGYPIGYCTQLTQNNSGFSYVSGFGNRSVHIALIGDPTLRMHMVKPPTDLVITEQDGHALLSWQAANDEELGYYIYRKVDDEYVRLNEQAISTTAFVDSFLQVGTYTYMVKTLKLETSASGSYYNLSLGVEQSTTITIVNTNQVAAPMPLRLYPNPARTLLSLDCPTCSHTSVRIINAKGQSFFSGQLHRSPLPIAVANWPSGWYLVQWRVGKEWRSLPFIKME
ncbi:MAG: fibronectin type III domain-containing protein [Bacteroidota bacterium]